MKALAALVLVGLLALSARPAAAINGYPSGHAGDIPRDVTAAQVVSDADVQAKIDRLVQFRPSRGAAVVRRVAAAMERGLGARRRSYDAFLRARLRDFEGIVEHYGMRANDLSTARAFAIVAGYKAYNGDHLTDATSGSIFRTMLALQTAAPQWYEPWSDARKQDLYTRWALQGSVLNWLDDEARKHSDTAAHAAVRVQARLFLRQQLGRDPDTVKLDQFACAVYRDEDCGSLMRRLRSAFETSTVVRSP